MPVVALPANTVITDDGAIANPHASSAQNSFDNTGDVMLVAIVTTGSVNLTFKNQTTQDGNPGPDKVVTCTVGTWRLGPFPKGIYNNAQRQVEVDVSIPGNCTLEAITLKPVQ